MAGNLGKKTGLVGGKRRGQTYIEKIEMEASRRNEACKPRRCRKLKPGEEKQMVLPGLEKMRRTNSDGM